MNPKLKKNLIRLMNNDRVEFFVGNILSKDFVLKNDLSIPTMGTDGVTIFYTDSWIDKCTNEEIQFSIVHEFFHIIFKHAHWVEELKLNQMVANIAQDVVINAILQQDDIGKCPEGVIRADYNGTVKLEINGIKFEFKDAHLKNFLTIYKEIMAKAPPQGNGGKGGLTQGGKEAKTLDEIIPKKLTEEEQADVDDEVGQMNASARMKGIGSGLARVLDILTTGVVPWQNYIRPTIDRATAGFPTYSRPNRRATTMPILQPSIRRIGVNVTIAIDTSGSISEKELSYFLGEIDHLLGSYPKGAVTVNALYHTDRVYSIQKNAKYIKDVISKVQSGGTCHLEVFEKAEELKSKILICLTDGYSSYPKATSIHNVIFICIEKNGKVPEFARRIDVDMSTIGGK